jgi:SAM-dependent methyltransferase
LTITQTLGNSKLLNIGAYAGTIFFMLWALYNALTYGWDYYSDYIPFLPKGFRIFAAWPYSILVFGILALYCIKRYGWPGLFFAAAINELWELAYDMTPAVIQVRYCPEVYSVPGQNYLFCAVNESAIFDPHFFLYIGQGIALVLFAFAMVLQFRGYTFSIKNLGKLFILQWLFSIATWPWSIWYEFLAEVSVVLLFFLLEVPQDAVSIYGQATDKLDEKFFDHQTEQGFSVAATAVANSLKTILSPTEALDVGCGKGFLVRQLNLLGVKSCGMDKSLYAIQHRASGLDQNELMLGDISARTSLMDGYFDLVTCIGVLQYLDDKHSALREMRRLLQTGGKLFIAFPLHRRSQKPFAESVEHLGFKFLPDSSEELAKLYPYILGRKFGLLSKWPFKVLIPRFQKDDFAFLCFQAI